MERFLDDQETPPTPVPRDRPTSPVHSLLFGDPKRNQLKPQSEMGMGDCHPGYQPILQDININTGSPTVVCRDPKLHSPSEVENFALQNGLPIEGYVSPFKKSKVSQINSISELAQDVVSSTASTTTQNHIDSLAITSVDSQPANTLTDLSLTSSTVSSVSLGNVDLGSSRNAEAVMQ